MSNHNRLSKLLAEINKYKNPAKAKVYAGFFKTGPGYYGEGDRFLGLTVPQQREISKKYLDLSLTEIKQLLLSPIHEHRFTALAILVLKFNKANQTERAKIYRFYVSNAKAINNWDLVDSSAEYIVGEYLLDKNKSILYKLAKSKNLWEKRIAIISTFAFIKRGQFSDTLKIAKILLSDPHDLIHKAVGWMLREIGKRSMPAEEKFLQQYQTKMSRTTLRYAIERFPEAKKKFYMKSKRIAKITA